MIVLGIESSCDETSVSILANGKVVANLIASQHFHNKFGGVIPELSSRAHLQQIIPLLKSALIETKLKLTNIDFFPALPDDLETKLEASSSYKDWSFN